MSYIVIACSRFGKVALKVLSVERISEIVDRKVCLHVTFKRKSVSCYTKSNAASEDVLIGIVVKISNAQKVDVLIILGSCLTAVVGLGKDIYLLSLIDVTGFKFGNIFSCQNISEISFSLRSKKSYLSARLITMILVIVVPQLGVLVLNNDILLVGVVSCYSYQCVCRCSRTALMRDLYESIKILIICYRGRLCKINIKIVLNVMLGECYGSCIAFLGACRDIVIHKVIRLIDLSLTPPTIIHGVLARENDISRINESINTCWISALILCVYSVNTSYKVIISRVIIPGLIISARTGCTLCILGAYFVE